MSRLEIFAFNKDGDAFHSGDHKTPWGGSIAIWQKLSESYNGPFSLGTGTVKIWKMWKELSDMQDVALGFTFDRCWVKRENIKLLTDALQVFYNLYLEPDGIVDTIPRAIEVLRKAAADESLRGVAFNGTSVSECLWYVRQEVSEAHREECYTCAQCEPRPYNLDNDEGHWELFEELAIPKEMPPETPEAWALQAHKDCTHSDLRVACPGCIQRVVREAQAQALRNAAEQVEAASNDINSPMRIRVVIRELRQQADELVGKAD